MKHKKIWLLKPVYVLLIIISAVLMVALFFSNITLFLIMLPFVLAAIGYCVYALHTMQKEMYSMVKSVGQELTNTHNSSLIDFPIAALIISDSGEVVWYNDSFKDGVLKEHEDIFGLNFCTIVGQSLEEITSKQGLTHYNDGYYETFSFNAGQQDANLFMIYFVDVTKLKKTAIEFKKTHPVVMILLIDNYDDTIKNNNESEKSLLLSHVQNVLQEFMDKTSGFIKKLDSDRYLAVIEQQHLDEIIATRFDILDKTREIMTENHVSITLSIGIAQVKTTLKRAENEARQSLDMALGRGGDQVAMKTDAGYEFFGGVSKGVEKRTKVKTRIVANALTEMVKNSSNVLVMGHKYADLDSLGSAIGIAKACTALNRSVNIVIDKKRNLASCLIEMMEQNDKADIFVDPDLALELVNDKTLLIILDTHSPSLIESADVFNICKTVVVIDHHRKVVNYIDSAVIFFHEPYASSTSEMVTELVQYFGDRCVLTHVEAQALLAGIMLDTRNFAMKTGVRTFEAAAYLRRVGADTGEVRKLFASTMDSYQRKTRVVSSAEVYKNCAIATCDFISDDMRLIAPQAADELLGISNVDASFVLFEQDEIVNISARSMGNLNVQVVMENFGGGGHQSMAGAQVKNSSCDKVRQMLLEIIDKTDIRKR
ncbi:MAG: DHH family phosphoesterase [Oscillospiraceae bacterium]